jgi:hypothetical protein
MRIFLAHWALIPGFFQSSTRVHEHVSNSTALYAGSRDTAIDCPLIPERDKNEIAARKAEALAFMRGRPAWQSRTGRIHPNVPYPGGVNPTTADTEKHEQSKN